MEIEEAKRRARSGPMMLFARRIFGIGITLLSTVTIARLVSPKAYGLANMSVVLFALAQIFREFGLTNAVLRKGTISQEEMSFLFWLNAGMTVVLAIVMALLAIPASLFYDEPIVANVMYVSVIGFVIGGLSLQHRALMGRDLRFGTVALIDSIALGIGYLTTLTLAFIRHDVWAIVIGTVVQSSIASVLYVTISGWKPGRYAKPAETKDLLKFGANSSIFSMCMFFSDNAASIVIGHFLGPAPLGQYTRAQALYKLPNANLVQPIVQSAMPLMTRLRPFPQEYRVAYLELVTRLCAFLFPISIMLTFAAVPLVTTMLGNRWDDAGRAFFFLAPSLTAFALGYCTGDLFITQNRSAELRSIGLIEMTVRVSAIVIGVQFGLAMTALAFTISNSIMAIYRAWVAGRSGPVSFLDQLQATVPAAPLAIGALLGGSAAWAFNWYDPMTAPILTIVTLCSSGAVALLIGLIVPTSRHALHSIANIFGFDKLVRKVSRRPAAGKA